MRDDAPQVRRMVEAVRRGAVRRYYGPCQPRQGPGRQGVALHPAVRATTRGKGLPGGQGEPGGEGTQTKGESRGVKRKLSVTEECVGVKQEGADEEVKELDGEGEGKVEGEGEEEGEGDEGEGGVVPRYVPPAKEESVHRVPVPRGGGMTKYRCHHPLPTTSIINSTSTLPTTTILPTPTTRQELVVGNVSRWLPMEEREGAATHKWMVYLRGGRGRPDLSAVVARVQVGGQGGQGGQSSLLCRVVARVVARVQEGGQGDGQDAGGWPGCRWVARVVARVHAGGWLGWWPGCRWVARVVARVQVLREGAPLCRWPWTPPTAPTTWWSSPSPLSTSPGGAGVGPPPAHLLTWPLFSWHLATR